MFITLDKPRPFRLQGAAMGRKRNGQVAPKARVLPCLAMGGRGLVLLRSQSGARTADNRLHAVCSDNALCCRSDTDNETAQVNPFSPSPRSRLTVDQESGCRIAHLTLALRVCAVAVTEAGRDGDGSAGQAERHAESLC